MRHLRRKASALIYACVLMFALSAMVALAVDWGRVQLCKSELHAAADAAARYAVAGLQNDISGSSAAYANATQSVAQNKANGQAIVFDATQDVVIGVWSKTARTFVPNTDLTVANAVKVTVQCSAARGTAVPMAFLSLLGRKSNDVSAVSIAMVDYSGNAGAAGNGKYEYFIPATSDPWLAGEPYGTIASVNNPNFDPDYAGYAYTDTGAHKTSLPTSTGFLNGGTAGSASNPNPFYNNYMNWGSYATKGALPIQAGGIAINPGVGISMDGVNGGANNLQSNSVFDADGDTGNVVSNSAGAENGIANVNAPLNSVIGIFVNDNVPSNTAAPTTALDFSTTASRDFLTLKPGLKQPFFIGDGRTSNGEVQQFIPPVGATRLFIGTMDAYEWSNNKGGFTVTAHAKGRIITVK